MKDENIIKLEEGSDLSKIVVSIELAQKLKDLGIPQKSILGYYQNDKFICSAFTFDEVVKFIPEMIEVTENTYLARFDGYDKISKNDVESAYAEVTHQRTDTSDTPCMAVCRCKGRMVAFSINEKGLYNNLICCGHNQATAAGLMLIELFKEGKVLV